MNQCVFSYTFLHSFEKYRQMLFSRKITLQETNISPKNGILKMIFLFPRWDMLIPWRVGHWLHGESTHQVCLKKLATLPNWGQHQAMITWNQRLAVS